MNLRIFTMTSDFYCKPLGTIFNQMMNPMNCAGSIVMMTHTLAFTLPHQSPEWLPSSKTLPFLGHWPSCDSVHHIDDVTIDDGPNLSSVPIHAPNMVSFAMMSFKTQDRNRWRATRSDTVLPSLASGSWSLDLFGLIWTTTSHARAHRLVWNFWCGIHNCHLFVFQSDGENSLQYATPLLPHLSWARCAV